MARIRTVKPSFFMSRAVKKLSDKQKLVWQGLWPNADDEGRLLDEPGILIGQLWALDVTAPKLDQILTELHAAGRIIRYEVAGEKYIQVTNWHEHQKINRPAPSLIPPVPVSAHSVSPHGDLTPGREGKGIGKEGEASSDAEPPSKCSLHWTLEFPPNCPQCAQARRNHTAWTTSQKAKPTPGPVRKSDLCPEHPDLGYSRSTCPMHVAVAS